MRLKRRSGGLQARKDSIPCFLPPRKIIAFMIRVERKIISRYLIFLCNTYVSFFSREQLDLTTRA